jgi:N-hydroxyarylamine O-acetyltransferase
LDVQSYLQRISYGGGLDPTPQTLQGLQLAHLLAVPFENLSIHAGQPIVLEDEALFDKIVRRWRGGFCYELNGLFASLLRALGFDVAMLSAQVAVTNEAFGPEFDHMALMVTLDERWLVDVGFGDSFLTPLLLDERREQVQGERSYQILLDGTYLTVMQRLNGDDWKAQYRFTLNPYQYYDFLKMCHYHQTSPRSHFTRAPICSRATEEGRVTLRGMRLITSSVDVGRQERELRNKKEYEETLRDYFGIVM